MRSPRFTDADNRVRQTTWAFANGRLEDTQVLQWAIGLDASQEAERISLRDLFDRQAESVREPFALAWRCVFEYWQRPDVETIHDKFLVRRRLAHGGTQRDLIRLIVESVRPWLKVDTSKQYRALSGEEQPKKPKYLKHLVWASISSGDRLTPDDIHLQEINDRNFLFELATALNAALLSGLNLARMIGSISKDIDITNWQVHRVYYVPPAQHAEGGGEPDRHSDGFAPATKLMFAVTERLVSVDVEAARRIVASWDASGWKLYRRLWAAAARNSELADGDDISGFLERISDAEFWWVGSYPEIAEVRALRWRSLSDEHAARLERRLLKGEPVKLIPNSIGKAEIPRHKRQRILIELQRIRAAGGGLSAKAVKFIEEAAEEFPNSSEIDLSYGFNQGVRVFSRGRTTAQSFEGIGNTKLLNELAKALADSGWDDKSQNASEFIAKNAAIVLDLLERSNDKAVASKVWQAFGYSFKPSDLNVTADNASVEDRGSAQIALQACRLLIKEDSHVIRKAVSGLSSFISSWDLLLSDNNEFYIAWIMLWPFAIEKTLEDDDSYSSFDIRAYNSPVGMLAFAILRVCPPIQAGDDPMSRGFWPQILSALAKATGEARLEVQYVLVRQLGYFMAAAPGWAMENLLKPLKSSVTESKNLVLWEAFGSGQLPQHKAMSALAESIVAAVLSKELSSKVRGDLAERVMWSLLFDRQGGNEPAVPITLVQQMLRMGDDDVRKESVHAFSQFLKRDDELEERARFEIVKSVFDEVWPKELTLSSKAVSGALAELPAAARTCYAEAAELVLPYLGPFDCWSLWDYGVLDHNDPDEKLHLIDNLAKARALLSVLDKTVGGDEGAIIPHGLEDALRHIARLAPKLERDIRFQRLLTLGRR